MLDPSRLEQIPEDLAPLLGYLLHATERPKGVTVLPIRGEGSVVVYVYTASELGTSGGEEVPAFGGTDVVRELWPHTLSTSVELGIWVVVHNKPDDSHFVELLPLLGDCIE